MNGVVALSTRRAGSGPGRGGSLAAAALAAALVGTLPAVGNLRAPRRIPEAPSAALAAPGEGLTVEKERLDFLCGADACTVTAEYAVFAPRETRVLLEMILPVAGDVTATTNGAASSVRVVPATPLDEDEARNLPEPGPGVPPLYRAAFDSALREGRNTVAVRYSQPLGGEEVDYGRSRTGRMVRRFRYEAWPLREWSRSPGFRIELAIGVERPAPGLWARLFGHPLSVACLTSDPASPSVAGRLAQKGNRLWLEAELGPSFPDRLTCYIGDENLMPRY